MSKGSGRRPQEVPDEKVKSEWERLFGSELKRKYTVKELLESDEKIKERGDKRLT